MNDQGWIMSSTTTNPYTHGTPEHTLWARWHSVFFEQPIHGQLLSIESHLRASLTALRQTNAHVSSPEVQRDMHSHLREIEESVNLLKEAAEHAFVRVVTGTSESLYDRETP